MVVSAYLYGYYGQRYDMITFRMEQKFPSEHQVSHNRKNSQQHQLYTILVDFLLKHTLHKLQQKYLFNSVINHLVEMIKSF